MGRGVLVGRGVMVAMAVGLAARVAEGLDVDIRRTVGEGCEAPERAAAPTAATAVRVVRRVAEGAGLRDA